MLPDALRAAWREPRVPVSPAPPWWDRALVAVLVPASVIEGLVRDDVPWVAFSIGSAVVCVVAILARRAFPLAALVVAFAAQTAAGLGPDIAGHDYGVLYTTSCVLLFPYSVCRWGAGRQAIIGVSFVLACHFGREPFYDESGLDLIVGAGFLLLPAAMGTAVRLFTNVRRRELDEARMLERTEIARELHDTVAHHMSAIVIQAQAGRTVAAVDPGRAVAALSVIEDAASRSLTEMRAMVGVLRDGRDAELAPARGAGGLEELVAAAGGGLSVAIERRGDLGGLPSALDAAIYRIVQESVTNARRHARGATRVDVGVTGAVDSVVVVVCDDGTGSEDPRGGGYGLVGMAERVDLLGGTFSAGPRPGGGWIVRAEIPRRAGSA